MHKTVSKQLSFPILPENQLLSTFNSLQINASSALRSPNVQNIKELYQQILLRLLDCSLEGLFSPEDVSVDFSYPELHEHSTSYSSFLIIFPKVLNFAGIEDFHEIKDLAKPNKKRVVVVLSGLLNLLKFSNAIKEFSLGCEAETQAEENELEMSKTQLSEMRDKREKLKKSLAKDSEQIQSINDEIVTKKTKITEIRSKLSKTQKEEEKELKSLEKAKLSLEKTRRTLKEKSDHFTFLKSQIVSSPEKIKSILNDLRQQIEIKRKVEERTDRKLKQLRNGENVTKKLSEKIDARIEDCAQISKIQAEIRQGRKGTKQLAALIEEAKNKVKSLGENKEVLVSSQDIENRRHSQLNGEVEKQRRELESAWVNVRQSEKSARKSREQEGEKAAEMMRKISEVEARIKVMQKEQKALEMEADEEMTQFDSWSEDYCARLEGLFGDVAVRENKWGSEIYEGERLTNKKMDG